MNPKRDIWFALLATLCFGAASGIFQSTLNNYLSDVHHLDAAMRDWLEFPRALPGFLIMLIAGVMLTILCGTQMAVFAMLFSALGALGLDYLAPDKVFLIAWIVIWSIRGRSNHRSLTGMSDRDNIERLSLGGK